MLLSSRSIILEHLAIGRFELSTWSARMVPTSKVGCCSQFCMGKPSTLASSVSHRTCTHSALCSAEQRWRSLSLNCDIVAKFGSLLCVNGKLVERQGRKASGLMGFSPMTAGPPLEDSAMFCTSVVFVGSFRSHPTSPIRTVMNLSSVCGFAPNDIGWIKFLTFGSLCSISWIKYLSRLS